MKNQNRYLQERSGNWHYVRSVPRDIAGTNKQKLVRLTLGTQSLEVARLRRDAMEEADDIYWASMRAGEVTGENAYRAAQRRALGYGLTYRTAPELARSSDLGDLLDRILMLENRGVVRSQDLEAVLGGVEKPRPSVSEVWDIYFTKICAEKVKTKSEKQLKDWKKVKNRALRNFTALCGDKPVDMVSREDAIKMHDWWRTKLIDDGLSPNSANRDIGNMRVILADYYKYIGDDDFVNPFRNLTFEDRQTNSRPPFETAWIRDKIMAPVGGLSKLNDQARMLVFAMIETGARPSELANLVTAQIHLGHEVPHIEIKPRAQLEIKTHSSVRKIPLVGVALEAMKRCPDGFPRYLDKGDGLSQLLLKVFETNDLFPSEDHVIYSLRHSFEKRMEEGGLDYGLRMRLMGHSTDRPEYGDGGSLEYRRDQLLKIVLPFDVALFDAAKD